MDIFYFDSTISGHKMAANILKKNINAVLSEKKEFNLGISGGATMRDFFGFITGYFEDIPERVNFYFTDERCVPLTDFNSNFDLINTVFFQPGNISAKRIFPIDTVKNDILKKYAKILPPRMDCIILGMGMDGHIASLFQEQDLAETSHKMIKTMPPSHISPQIERISMTISYINSAAKRILLLPGPEKMEIFNSSMKHKFPISGLDLNNCTVINYP